MKLLLLITSLFFSCFSFGQDTLSLDTISKTVPHIVPDTQAYEPVIPVAKDSLAKKKKKKQKVKESKVKETIVVSKPIETNNSKSQSNRNGIVLIGLLIIGLLLVIIKFYRSRRRGGDDPLSDCISRILLPRREYYRNVYLKSEAWKRKRYVVLRRDNWRCVYCGAKATEVHHTRYAKINIGKEPIEWLVSVCRPCHNSIHQ